MALSDFKKYVASKGGGSEQYVDPNTGKIKTETTGGSLSGLNTPTTTTSTTTTTTTGGLDFGAANNVGSLSGLKNPAPIGPGLGMVNSNTNVGKSAWETAKDKASEGVAAATKQEYISYLDQQTAKPDELTAPGVSASAPTAGTVGGAQTETPSLTNPILPAAPTVPAAPTTPTTPNVPQAAPPSVPEYGGNGGAGGAGAGNTPSGSASLPTATDMSDYINEYYAIAEERAKNSAEEAYLSALEAIDAEAARLPGYYEEARRQQTGQSALERKAMNERLAASGLNTGAAGQAALAQNAVNQNAMAQIRQAEADAMADVESRRREVAIEYEAKVRDAVLSGDMAKAQALFAEAQRVDESIVNVAMQQAQLDIQRQQLEMQAEKTAYNNAYQKAQDAEARAEAKAKMLASVGDFSGYRALGYTDDEIAVLKGYWDAENVNPTYSYSGVGGSPAGGTMSGVSGNSGDAPLMGAQAQSLYGAVSKGLMDAGSASYVLESGLANGTISRAEAEYIMAAMGYY